MCGPFVPARGGRRTGVRPPGDRDRDLGSWGGVERRKYTTDLASECRPRGLDCGLASFVRHARGHRIVDGLEPEPNVEQLQGRGSDDSESESSNNNHNSTSWGAAHGKAKARTLVRLLFAMAFASAAAPSSVTRFETK